PMAPLELKSLLRLVGPAITAEILLEGRVFDASEALSKGLLTRVYPDMLLGNEVDVSVKNILKGAPMAAQINKKTIKVLSNIGTNNIDLNMQEFFGYADSNDHKEGIKAFLEGRAPKFSGD